MRRCTGCKKELPLSRFSVGKVNNHVYQPCRACKRAKASEKRAADDRNKPIVLSGAAYWLTQPFGAPQEGRVTWLQQPAR